MFLAFFHRENRFSDDKLLLLDSSHDRRLLLDGSHDRRLLLYGSHDRRLLLYGILPLFLDSSLILLLDYLLSILLLLLSTYYFLIGRWFPFTASNCWLGEFFLVFGYHICLLFWTRYCRLSRRTFTQALTHSFM